MEYRFVIQKTQSDRYFYLLIDPSDLQLFQSHIYKTEIECRVEISRMRELIKSSEVIVIADTEYK